ncbi:ATP-binding protein [candidate division KSB1 bacterium]|nr:ATP-binding protein [candidate division KSB1 bacterium]
MNTSAYLDILVDWNYWGDFKSQLKKRKLYLKRVQSLFSPRTALSLLGIRRAGKSSIIHLYLQELFAHKILEPQNSLIINLEDPRFTQQLTTQDLHQLLETYLQNLNPTDPIIVLDEVQNVAGWERFVRYLLEAKNFKVIVTGSSSKLLDQELATVLTGRHVDIEVFPLTLKEILEFEDLPSESPVQVATNKISIKRTFDEYFQWGGFPEIYLSDSIERKRELLFRYFDDIIFKDLVKRFNIQEVHKLEQLANILITNIATLQSYNRLKTQIGVSLDTVERFVRYFEIARMFFFLKKYEYSIGEQIRSVHKVYLIDNGFYTAKGFRFSENVGRLAENLVAVELFKRRLLHPNLELYYWKDYQQREVDFVVKLGAKVNQLIQVCWNVSDPRTLKREVNNLLRASQELGCYDLMIITEDFEDRQEYSINSGTCQIQFLPLWKFLLI